MPSNDTPEFEAALEVVAAEWDCAPGELRALLSERSGRPAAAATAGFGAETIPLTGALEHHEDAVDNDAEHRMPDRYEDLGRIGQGAMGEVRRVRDRHLQRTLAMKIIHAGIMTRSTLARRFESEARATARLQHPGIVPVHDMGRLADGRVWFTMKEVRGRELAEVVRDVHAVSGAQWQATESGWTLRRLVEAFRRICETMSYAHSKGVIHRDLKPNNIMVGEHGEVMVLDWGIAKQLPRSGVPASTSALLAHEPDSEPLSSARTQLGVVAGTPAYMAPEQARGENDKIDARTDVYALGAVLHHLLVGRAPNTEHRSPAVLTGGLAGPARALPSPEPQRDAARGGPPLPPVLVALSERCMARDPAHRPQSAGELVATLSAWLDGVQRRDNARKVIDRAGERQTDALQLKADAHRYRQQAEDALREIQSWQPEEDRHQGWEHQDAAAALERESTLLEVEAERLLQASLTHAPDLIEAHAALADTYRARHAELEARGGDLRRAEAFLKQHIRALPPTDTRRASHLRYLAGDGTLTLLTEPPGARVTVHRHELVRKRRRLGVGTVVGETPLRHLPIPMGSYTCVVQHPSRAPVWYPIFIERGQHWSGIAPGESESTPIHLPAQRSPDELDIPAGWFRAGAADGLASRHPAQTIWCDSFVMMRDQVSNADYCAYLNHLLDCGEVAAAARAVPEVTPTGDSPWILRDGRYTLQGASADHSWTSDHPVHFISWFQAVAYAQWYADQTGQPWRLPNELEWEKAARGTDGRHFPWGDTFCPAWCHVAGSVRDASGPSVIGAFPVDLSPYGVRDMAGNVMDWCADVFQVGHMSASTTRVRVDPPPAPPIDRDAHRVLRGGAWCYHAEYARLTARGRGRPSFKSTFTGMRLVRSLDVETRRL